MKSLIACIILSSLLLTSRVLASSVSCYEGLSFPHPTKTQVLTFPADWHVANLDNHLLVTSTLENIVDYEMGKSRYQPEGDNGFTLEEARDVLPDTLYNILTKKGISTDKFDEMAEKVFSETYFHGKDIPISDTTSENEEESIFKLLSRDSYLGITLFNAIQFDKKLHTMNQDRINPRCHMVPAETVRKWFYTRFSSCYKMTIEAYEACDKSTLAPGFFEQYFTFPEKEEDRQAYYLTHSFGFLTQDLIQDILSAARRIKDMASQNDRLIIFGNTPYFVGRALERLYEKETSHTRPELIFLPFSGAPNTYTERNRFGAIDDIVIPSRHSHMMSHLKSKGLMDITMLTGTTYVLDQIGSGSGPAYIMGNILEHFGKEGLMPNFHVLSINPFDSHSHRHSTITSFFPKDGQSTILSFPNKETPFFHVPATVVSVKDHSILDEAPDCCSELRIVPKNNAIFWNPLYDDRFNSPMFLTAKLLCDHFDINVKYLLSQT